MPKSLEVRIVVQIIIAFILSASFAQLYDIPRILIAVGFWQAFQSFGPREDRRSFGTDQMATLAVIALLAYYLDPLLESSSDVLEMARIAAAKGEATDPWALAIPQVGFYGVLAVYAGLCSLYVGSLYREEFKAKFQELRTYWNEKRDTVITFIVAEVSLLLLFIFVHNKAFSLLTFASVFLISRYLFKTKARLRTSSWILMVLGLPFAYFVMPGIQEHIDAVSLLQIRIRHGETQLLEEFKALDSKSYYVAGPAFLFIGVSFLLRNRAVQKFIYRGRAKILIDEEPATT